MDFQHFSHLLQWECSRTEEGLHFRPSTILSSSAKNHTYTSDAGYSLNDGAISITCLKKQQPIADFCNPFQNQIFTLLKYQINLHPYAALQTENTLLLLLKSKGFGKEKPSALPTVGKRSLERKVHRLPLYPKDSLFTQRSPEEGH